MVDVLTKEQRSFNMSRIRSRDTGPEIKFRDILHSRGIKGYIMHPHRITGKPDFYFPKEKIALFVDGCFWHGCRFCFQLPRTNGKFWELKIKSNIMRDRMVNKKLTILGIEVIRIREHELKKDPEGVLHKIREKLINVHSLKVLDLFAGAGGLSEGFVRAGFDIVAHIEADKNVCSTLVTRMIYHALIKKHKMGDYKNYVRGMITRDALIEKYNLQKEKDSIMCAKIGKDNYKELIRKIKKRLSGEKIDIIVGGPPCQAYSYIGRARDDNNMRRDERNFLYKYYIEFLKELKPKIFVFENVPGLKSAGKGRHLKKMRYLMKKAGYNSGYRILNTVDFGVPQNRKRIIIIGWNKLSKLTGYPNFTPTKRDYLVKDFLSDLPKIKSGEGKEIIDASKRNYFLEKLGISNPQFRIIMNHTARPNSRRDLEIYKRAILAKEKGKNIKYNHLPKTLKTHNNENGFLDRFKVIDFCAKGSHTIVAHIAKDGHFYIHPDRKQNRSLTVREAARLQTFPDDYKFEGKRGPQFRQIGNAVPPAFSEIIARELIKKI